MSLQVASLELMNLNLGERKQLKGLWALGLRLESAGCPLNPSSVHFINSGFWALYWLQRGEAQAVGFPDCPLTLHRSTK